MADKEKAYVKEVVHVVREGQSLSLIAREHMKKGWQAENVDRGVRAIWIYNTQVLENLKKRKKDVIWPKDEIVIPRTIWSYKSLIARYTELAEAVYKDNSAEKSLSTIKKDADRFGSNIDLAAAMLTLTVGVGFKLAELAKLEAAAGVAAAPQLGKALTASEKVAAGIANDILLFIATTGAGAVSDKAEMATTAVLSTAPKGVQSVQQLKAMAAAGAKAAARAAVASGMLFMLALEYAKPSALAKWWTKYDLSLRQAELSAVTGKADTLAFLAQKTTERTAEMNLLWGKAP